MKVVLRMFKDNVVKAEKIIKRIFVLLKILTSELSKDIERGDNFDEMLGTYKGREYLKYSIKCK